MKNKKVNKPMEKCLLSVKEMMEYTGLGDSSIRKILNDPKCEFTVRIGNRLYANKKLFDEWLNDISGN